MAIQGARTEFDVTWLLWVLAAGSLAAFPFLPATGVSAAVPGQACAGVRPLQALSSEPWPSVGAAVTPVAGHLGRHPLI